MPDGLEIRDSAEGDFDAIEMLYPEAFPEENLLPLVRDLLKDPTITASLVGTIESRIAAHAIFTYCGVAGSSVKSALLGPLAVAPTWQRQGIGTALVRAGLQRVLNADVRLVCVLGDPAFYSRLGFARESSVEPPYRLPPEWDDAWQSQYLGDTRIPIAGKLSVPPQWLQPALWAP